jgi:hypothetical protein
MPADPPKPPVDALARLPADLTAAPGSDSALTLPFAGTPAEPAAELLTIEQRYDAVRRDGQWTLPATWSWSSRQAWWDANELAARYCKLGISRDAGDDTPEMLRVRLVGRMRYGRIETRWVAGRLGRQGPLSR